MVNKPRIKGTIAETAVVGFLREHGFPWAERRSLNGALDKGDVTGCPGLCIEIKSAGSVLKIAQWIAETAIEKFNAGADHGILVVKPNGFGVQRVGSWYAIMTSGDFNQLWSQALGSPTLDVVVKSPEPSYFSAVTLSIQLQAGTRPGRLAEDEVLALLFRPPNTKHRPDAWYRIMTLDHMTRLLRAAGYGEPSDHSNDQPDPAGLEPRPVS